jgi:alpha-L-fucosidase 2
VQGNGKIGASVFGGVQHEQIMLNDMTLWFGEPVKKSISPNGYKHLPGIRKALKDENHSLAEQLNIF